jgi:hypothetical protein
MSIRTYIQQFWHCYERHYVLNITIATLLFILQIIHLYWLTADVVAERLVGRSFWQVEGIWEFIIVFVDYLEIPAIISVSLIYINELRKRWQWKPILYLLLLNSQWLHLFWITDEFVIEQFREHPTGTVLPVWLAWVAILIDYLEIPVMIDTINRFIQAVKQRRVKQFLAEDLRKG